MTDYFVILNHKKTRMENLHGKHFQITFRISLSCCWAVHQFDFRFFVKRSNSRSIFKLPNSVSIKTVTHFKIESNFRVHFT